MLCKIHNITINIISYETLEVKDTVHVSQMNEVKPESIVKAQKRHLCSQQNHRISDRVWKQTFMIKQS